MNFVITAGHNCIELPLENEVVRNHFVEGSSFVQFQLREINLLRVYDPIFAGRKHLTLLDLGANIGLVSVYASDVCDHIVAVEPAPKTFAVLERMALCASNISTLRAAVVPVDGECVFHVNDINTTANSVVNTCGDEIKVNGMTLKSVIQVSSLDHVDICKVDIEGSEAEALSLEQLEWARPIVDAYYVETHNCPFSHWEQKLGELVENFARSGYTKMQVRRFNAQDTELGHPLPVYAQKP